MSFGVLTLATERDYLKAIGLLLSLRVSNPGVPVAIACPEHVMKHVEPYFDYVIKQDPTFKGFAQKLNLDNYSPFDTTFFFDADVLVFKQLAPVVKKWDGAAYIARGRYERDGVSSFGLDRRKVLEKTGMDKFVVIDGAGHALFRKPQCLEIFNKAREVAKNYSDYAGDIKLADEDIMGIVMTLLELPPEDGDNFFSRYLSAKSGTLELKAENAHCKLVEVLDGLPREPVMMHFATNEGAFTYALQLARLFKKYGISGRYGLMKQCIRDLYIHNKNKLCKFIKS